MIEPILSNSFCKSFKVKWCCQDILKLNSSTYTLKPWFTNFTDGLLLSVDIQHLSDTLWLQFSFWNLIWGWEAKWNEWARLGWSYMVPFKSCMGFHIRCQSITVRLYSHRPWDNRHYYDNTLRDHVFSVDSRRDIKCGFCGSHRLCYIAIQCAIQIYFLLTLLWVLLAFPRHYLWI